MPIPGSAIAFYVIATLIVGSALIVTFSKNIIYSAFALLGTLIGAAALYIFLSSDFLAATQVIVYIGGIAVLVLFAVMLTHQIEKAADSNPLMGIKVGVPVGVLIMGLCMYAVSGHDWNLIEITNTNPTVHTIGNAFLNEFLLPFEFASVILLVVLISAALVARREITHRISGGDS
jgi:NADH-quinone oxidoreductase subunit J